MQIKSSNVNLSGMSPQLLLGLFVAEQVYQTFGKEVTITSMNDSVHSETSLHYSGNAADLRTQNPINGIRYFDDPHEVVRRIKSKLTGDFDVLYEEKTIQGKVVGHIHMEYQPRRKS